jgi:hypothetical protein
VGERERREAVSKVVPILDLAIHTIEEKWIRPYANPCINADRQPKRQRPTPSLLPKQAYLGGGESGRMQADELEDICAKCGKVGGWRRQWLKPQEMQ